jgi:Protein of unknown function (DUF2637)
MDTGNRGVVMTGSGRLIRAATAAAVTAVAGFAAVVSYAHIYDLGHAHGQDGTAARLLPLSVDGLILAASLVMLHEARARRPSPPLARVALWLGIGVTVAANVGYGVPYGPVAALLSSWPALAFVIAVEMLMGLVRTTARTLPPGGTVTGPRARADTLTSAGTTPGQPGPDTASGSAAARARTAVVSRRGDMAALIAANPAIKAPALAELSGKSLRTAQRALAGASNGNGHH